MKYVATIQSGFEKKAAYEALKKQNIKIYDEDPSGKKLTIEIPNDDVALSLSMLEEFASFVPLG